MDLLSIHAPKDSEEDSSDKPIFPLEAITSDEIYTKNSRKTS